MNIVNPCNTPTRKNGGQLNNSDAFYRERVSNPVTLFDSKQIFDKAPLFFDDQEVSGSGTLSSHSTNRASTTLFVANTTAGRRVRQTFQRFNYQPGKSQLIILTGVMGTASTGITKGIGYYDDENGLFFRNNEGTLQVVKRSYVSGSAVDTAIDQSDWNIDTMDGNGPSGINIDLDKTNIFFIDFEWLGVGRVRFGFFVDGVPFYCHEILNANVQTAVYMSTPNLPVRYEIENDGTGAADTLEHICCSVQSEGGQEDLGVLRHADSGAIGSLATGTKYAALGFRLKSTGLDVNAFIESVSLLSDSTNGKAHWELLFNPTVAGTFTYSDQTNSAVQIATGAVANTVSDGVVVDGGYFTDDLPPLIRIPNALRVGAAIDGTRDELVLAVRPITNNITIEASWTWRELL